MKKEDDKYYRKMVYRQSDKISKVLFAIMDGKCTEDNVEFYIMTVHKIYKEHFGIDFDYTTFDEFKLVVKKLQEYLEKKAMQMSVEYNEI